jgi:hypothetical protein
MELTMSDLIEPLPSMVLPRWLPRSEGAPLAPSIRGFMERQLHANLANVRIHTGAAAAALCEALGARAFTWGRDILFGADEYAPENLAGRRLLAHELAHVLQQRAANLSTRPAIGSVGAPDDPYETEADRVAEEVLGAGRSTPITPDGAGVLRRAMKVLADTAKITADVQGAAAQLDFYKERHGTDVLLFNLGRNNANLIKSLRGDKSLTADDMFAIKIEASVDVEIPKGGGDFDFHFIQLIQPYESWLFAGRGTWEGSVRLMWPPKQDYFLDSGDDFNGNSVMPYTNLDMPDIDFTPKGKRKGVSTVTARMVDHPHTTMPLMLPNDMTGVTNRLVHGERWCLFTTAFVYRDPAKKIHPLAYMEWQIMWEYSFKWDKNGLSWHALDQTLDVGQSKKGPPQLSIPRNMVENPPTSVTDGYNWQSNVNFFAALTSSQNSAVKTTSSMWTAAVPPDFYDWTGDSPLSR